jgi:surface polysaccharide O-acyltransferase-like enzyme
MGQSTALTLGIFVQGLNVIIRLMMLFPNLSKLGVYDIPWLITSLLSIGLSIYLVLRLDRTDVRVTLVT